MSSPFVSRSQWGARSAQGAMNSISSKPKGVAFHWEGPQMGARDHSTCDDLMRSIQNYHMDTQGWSDIAYNLAVCTHGYIYEGRGKGKGSSANGTSQANYDWYAVCALVGEHDAQPAALDTGLADAAAMVRSWGAGSSQCGHRDLYSTACPGNDIYNKMKSGKYGAGSSPTPPPSGGGSGGGGTAPAFPYPSDHYLGQESPDPKCHSGYYSADRPNIQKWQTQMLKRGWSAIGTADGYYGPKSESVCRAFQDEKNLPVDGLVGPTTWKTSWTAPVT